MLWAWWERAAERGMGAGAHMCLVIRCRNYFTRLSHYAVGKADADAGKLHKC